LRRSRLVRDFADFTVSTELIPATADAYIDKLIIGFQGDMTAAASVSVESMLGLLSEIEVRRYGSVVVSLSAKDLLALNCLWLGKSPLTIVATAATDDKTVINGLELPLYQPPSPYGAITYRFIRTAVSGVDTEKLTVAEIYSEKTYRPTYVHAVKLEGTTAAVTGYGNKLYPTVLGDLIGVLIFSTTIPTNVSNTVTCEKIKIFVDGVPQVERNWRELQGDAKRGMQAAVFASPGNRTIHDNYAYLDLQDDPIPAGTRIEIDIYAGVANEAFHLIPVYLVPP